MEKATRWYWFIRWLAARLIGAFGGIKAIGTENVPQDGPVLLAPIHMSFLDPPVVGISCPRPVCYMAKEELFRPPGFSQLIRSLKAFPVKRGANDSGAIRLAIELLQSGECVLVFPEGGRNDGETLLEIQSGIAMLAKRSGAAIVPVGISGSQKMLPKGAKFLKRAKIKVVFGEPFTYADIESAEGKQASRDAFSRVMAERLVQATHEAGLPIKIAPNSRTQSPDSLHETPTG